MEKEDFDQNLYLCVYIQFNSLNCPIDGVFYRKAISHSNPKLSQILCIVGMNIAR